MYNLSIYPICVKNGKVEKNLPGLVSLNPPRKAARGREGDQLLLLVNLDGQNPLTPQAFQEWLIKKADIFYRTPGAVTTAMRSLAEAINMDLLERNLQRAKEGSQVNGSLCLVVLRKEISYSLVVGQARIFIIQGNDFQEITDNENHPRGLGMNQVIKCRFSQAEIKDKDQVLLAPIPGPTWTENALSGSTQISPESMGRRLFNQMPLSMMGALMRISPGTGQTVFLNFQTPEPQKSIPENSGLLQEEADSQPAPTKTEESPFPQATAQPLAEVSSIPYQPPAKGSAADETVDVMPVRQTLPIKPESQRVRPIPVEKRAFSGKSSDIKVQVGNAARALEGFQGKSRTTFKKILQKILPNKGDNQNEISRPVLLLIAILIPIVVVAFAGSVYLRKGKSQQFDVNFQQGLQYAQQAESLKEDPTARLANLQQSLYFLEKAAVYGSSPESSALHAQIQKELDSIQGIVRIRMKPITEGLDLGDVSITQMVATSNDLYLQDANSGRVFRYALSGKEYIQDTKFDCGPNPDNPDNKIGKVVDILAIPFNNIHNATLAAVDARGRIQYCIPETAGVVGKLIEPDATWRSVSSISFYQNSLYVLDAGRNAVYQYKGNGLEFPEKPSLFFDETIPDLSNAIDIEVNGDELYILRSNGEMVECTYSHIKDYKLTECQDPAPYTDNRSGETPQVLSFSGVQFIQMRITDAPDSSLYLLDTAGKRLFHLSLKRNLQKVMTPGFDNPGEVVDRVLTAEAISSGKTVFLAYEDLVYVGMLP